MSKMKDLYGILAEWYPDGVYTEQQLWEAIAEADRGRHTLEDVLKALEKGEVAEWL